jgi:CheY-like chemotaxis protein
MMTSAKRILVIEDDPDLLDALMAVLDLDGYQAFGASNGAQALVVIGQLQPDLIVLDLHMPVMDGQGFLRTYQQTPAHQVPVIGVSGYPPDSGDVPGIVGIVIKPYLPHELLDLIEKQLT